MVGKIKSNINYAAIGNRIKTARENNGYTQEKLAELAELSTGYIAGIETGRSSIGLQALIAIANVLKVSVDDLLQDNVTYAHSSYSKEIALLLEEESDELQNKISRIVRNLIEILK